MRSVDSLRTISIVISALVLLGGATMLLPGGAEFLGLRNEGGLPVVDFEQLTLGEAKDEYLVCPEILCLNAGSMEPAPEYDMTATELRDRFLFFIDHSPTIEVERMDPALMQFDLTERHRGGAFPDIITLRILAIGTKRSTLAIYSRSVPRSARDGENRSRVRRWLARIPL